MRLHDPWVCLPLMAALTPLVVLAFVAYAKEALRVPETDARLNPEHQEQPCELKSRSTASPTSN